MASALMVHKAHSGIQIDTPDSTILVINGAYSSLFGEGFSTGRCRAQQGTELGMVEGISALFCRVWPGCCAIDIIMVIGASDEDGGIEEED